MKLCIAVHALLLACFLAAASPLPAYEAGHNEAHAYTDSNDDERTRARLEYLQSCLNMRLSTPVRSQWLSDPILLKWHAYWLWSRTAPLREVPVRAVPWAQQPLWQESRWEAALGKPVQRCVNGTAYAAEMEFAREALESLGQGEEEDEEIEGMAGRHRQGPRRAATAQVYLPWPADESCPGLLVEEPFNYSFFHPWVPLFVHWDDVATAPAQTTHSSPFRDSMEETGTVLRMAQALVPHMRRDVQYVTLMARGAGFFFNSYIHFANLSRHVLVICPGGRGGHVPIPLLHPDDTQPPARPPPSETSHAAVQSCVLGFVGTLHEGLRVAMHEATVSHPRWKDKAILKESNHSDGETWKACMLQLAPRGTNPTSFRLYEALQGGHIPVYIWEDVLWLPYVDMTWKGREWCRGWMTWQEWQGSEGSVPEECRSPWHNWAVVVHKADYPAWLSHPTYGLAAWTTQEGRRRSVRRNIAAAREAFFTHEGVMAHVAQFIRDPLQAHLYCAP